MKLSKQKRQAFSLIEFSIIVLILGIIAAAITQSSILIRHFRLSSAQSQTQSSPSSSVTGLSLWLETSSPTSFNNEPEEAADITIWKDLNPQSNDKIDTVIPSGATAPKYAKSCVKYLPCLKFTGVETMQLGGSAFPSSTSTTLANDFSYIFALQATDTRGTDIDPNYLIAPESASGNLAAVAIAAGTDGVTVFQNSTSGLTKIATYDTNGSDVLKKPAVLEVYFSEGIPAIKINGYEVTNSGLITNSKTPFPSKFLGKSNATNGFKGYLTEVQFFSRKPTAAESKDVADYLIRKWHVELGIPNGTISQDSNGVQQIYFNGTQFPTQTSPVDGGTYFIISFTQQSFLESFSQKLASLFVSDANAATTALDFARDSKTLEPYTGYSAGASTSCGDSQITGIFFFRGYAYNTTCRTSQGKQIPTFDDGQSIRSTTDGYPKVPGFNSLGSGPLTTVPLTLPATQCQLSATGVTSTVVNVGSGSVNCNEGFSGGSINYECVVGGNITVTGSCTQTTCPVSGVGINETSVNFGTGPLTCTAGYSPSTSPALSYNCVGEAATITGSCDPITCTGSGTGFTSQSVPYQATAGSGGKTCDSGGTPSYTCTTQGANVTVTGCTAAPQATATGGDMTPIGGYNIHTFTTNGTFTVSGGTLTADVLVVGGGGGGGDYAGGGGGAGGLIYQPSFSVLSNSYTITIGAGGAGGSNNGAGSNGSDSSFSSLLAKGGGAGAGAFIFAKTGGSGGGGGGGSEQGTGVANLANPGANIAGQGNSGGYGYTSGGDSGPGGGGGGAGGVGGNASANIAGGNGGLGLANSISGTSIYYAGGGGGSVNIGGTAGTGGIGGGGTGAVYPGAPANALPNTGGGGGGSYFGTTGGNGGSGIVIIRYSSGGGGGSSSCTVSGTGLGGTVAIGATSKTCNAGYSGSVTFAACSASTPTITSVTGSCTPITCTGSGTGFTSQSVPYQATAGSGGKTCDSGATGTPSYTCTTQGSNVAVTGCNVTASVVGGEVDTIGGYKIHTFTSNGTLTVSGGSAIVDYLVVAGGGGGAGGRHSGGGGAGGYLEGSSYSLPAATYQITVGNGGSGKNVPNIKADDGENSEISGTGVSIISFGGGGGASCCNTSAGIAGNGGSGGGGAPTPTVEVGGTGVSGQGNSGGGGEEAPTYYGGGGGGGALSAGGNGTGAAGAGNGGNGKTSAISGTSETYAGGGGGDAWNGGPLGVGGTGGGGSGCYGNSCQAGHGVANTGGGGGAGASANNDGIGGNGGSGIVIVRYAFP